MTTITVPGPRYARPASVAAAGARVRLRLTARGRRVLAALAALPAVIALAIAMLAGGSAVASLDEGMPTQSFESVTVSSGDTLWAIAVEVAPHADPRDVVDGISRLNNLSTAQLVPGQVLAIPAQYSE